jgi:putative transposase
MSACRALRAFGGARGSGFQPGNRKRRRLWLADGSCIRLRPERPNHVWAYDFVEDRTCEGRRYRMLNIVDEFTRECLAIKVARKLTSMDVIETLADLFLLRECRRTSAPTRGRSSSRKR